MAKAKVTYKWNGTKLAEKWSSAMADGLTAGAIYLQREMKRNLSDPSPPRSLPEDFPGKETGNLRRSISFSAASPMHLASSAGVSLRSHKERKLSNKGRPKNSPSGDEINSYALWLEFGTSKMAPRPWALRSLRENEGEIVSVVMRTARRRMK